jgi:hypothetical protein
MLITFPRTYLADVVLSAGLKSSCKDITVPVERQSKTNDLIRIFILTVVTEN